MFPLSIGAAACSSGSPGGGSGSPGVTIEIDGVVFEKSGSIAPGATVVVSNKQLTLQMRNLPEQRAGINADITNESHTAALTSEEYGDWTYVADSVGTGATRVEIVRNHPGEVVVRWTFGRHQVGSAYVSDGIRRNYPFEKTIWMLSDQAGYYVLIEPRRRLPRAVESEHELGFGGLWGEADIRFDGERLETNPDKTTFYSNEPVNAAVLQLADDDLDRLLVMFPPSPLISPVFDDQNYGSVYRYGVRSESYGAFLGAVWRDSGDSVTDLCEDAIRRAPTELRALGMPDCARLN